MNKNLIQLILKRIGAVAGVVGGINLIMNGQPDIGYSVVAASLGSATVSQ